MKPNDFELEQAWGPLKELTRKNAHTRTCMQLHANGRVSELTAKLTLIDALQNVIRDFNGTPRTKDELRMPIERAVRYDSYGSLNALIQSLANQAERLAVNKAEILMDHWYGPIGAVRVR